MSIADKEKSISANNVTIAENEQKVYEAGKQAAYAEGDEGIFNAGKKSEYDTFWDNYQSKGAVYNANYMFGCAGWSDITFKPKYSQKYMNNAAYIFNASKIIDLKGILEKQGVVFNFENCAQLTYALAYSTITRAPIFSAKKAANLNYFAHRADKLTEVEIALKDDGSQTFTSAFTNCYELVDFIITSGVIGQSIDFQYSSKFSKASIISIMTALSTTSTGKTLTLSEEAVDKAFETSEGANDGVNSAEWTRLKTTRTNWTISLI